MHSAPSTAPAVLVVLRGNSGSGKSSVARALCRRFHPHSAWIEQDHLRRVVLDEKDVALQDTPGLLKAMALHCLAVGRHTFVEGILHASRYGPMLESLRDSHAGPTLFYGFDLTFDETRRRHAQRQRPEITEEMLRRWYHGWQPLPFCSEARIAASESLDATAGRIAADVLQARARAHT